MDYEHINKTLTMPKTILALTGIRSEYDILYPVLKALDSHPEFNLQVVVAGAHLAPRFGLTLKQIESDGFEIADKIESLIDSDTLSSRIKSGAIELLGLIQTVERVKPNFLIVVGDREESMMAALVGAYMNIAVVHLAGGDNVVGNVDDSVRNAVSKLAHLHFPFSPGSAERLLRMGEESWRVHCCGNPALDRFRMLTSVDRAALSKLVDFDLTDGPLVVVIQHVISSEVTQAAYQMRSTLQAVKKLCDAGWRAMIGYPNSDAGSREIMRVIDEDSPGIPRAKVYRNLPRLEFVSLLKAADVLLGNSSLGLLEAPFLKLPAINVGNRQKNREHASNVLFVPHDSDQIFSAVNHVLNDKDFQREMILDWDRFGNGYAAERMAEVLAEFSLDPRLLVKECPL
jgi:GDP/UDP-N,N'-diacetylbacillosamine 2-epimerase (hydrolysing)